MVHLILERLGDHDLPAVRALFSACEEYFIATTGGPASPAAAHSTFVGLPEGATYADKHILGICNPQTRELLGLIDAISGYPDPRTVTVGLFLVSPRHSRRLIREEACRLFEVWAVDRRLTTIRIAVDAVSLSFLDSWRKAGYTPAGDPVRDGRRLVVVFEKKLTHDTPGYYTEIAPLASPGSDAQADAQV